jgi:hypothetical protein
MQDKERTVTKNTTAGKRMKSNKRHHRSERKEESHKTLIQGMEGRITTIARYAGRVTKTNNAGTVRQKTNAGHERKNSVQPF